MLLPSKLFSYNETALSKLPDILDALEEPKPPLVVYHKIKGKISSPLEFMAALDILYALGEIELTEERMLTRCSKK